MTVTRRDGLSTRRASAAETAVDVSCRCRRRHRQRLSHKWPAAQRRPVKHMHILHIPKRIQVTNTYLINVSKGSSHKFAVTILLFIYLINYLFIYVFIHLRICMYVAICF